MPPLRTAIEDMPLAARLLEGLGYPLRGAALLACVALGVCHYAALLPGVVGILALIAVWIATLRYAAGCLVATADGRADPPAFPAETPGGNPPGIFVLHVFAVLACAAVATFTPGWLWLALLIAALLLPAINLSLAFDGDLGVALNPATWIEIVTRFGAAYLVPVAINAGLVVAIALTRASLAALPLALSLPLFGFVCTWLAILDFHWMGTLVWHYRERLGMQPETTDLSDTRDFDADQQLLDECAALAQADPEEAAIRLRDRMRERLAPAEIHSRFRALLRQLRRHDLLLSHGQTWIAQLCASGDERRALGVVQECREIDTQFFPSDPANTALLARAAARIGTHDLAWYLANGFVQRWPRHADAPALALLAAPH